jgi:N-acetylglucosamine malate deacetylase 1
MPTIVEQLVANHAALQSPPADLLNSRAPQPCYPKRDQTAPVCLIFSPHPDDECLIGGLPLRLGTEHAWRVVNLAITQGSDAQRQRARGTELRAACDYLGFECHTFGECGLTRINTATRERDPAHWQAAVWQVRQAIEHYQPRLILAPHVGDAQAAHVGTHWLMRDALQLADLNQQPAVALTEYWSTLSEPNLAVSLSQQQVAQLLTGLMQHVGEVSRNPYHLSLPAWLIDGVRRGSERVGLPGAVGLPFQFASLYRLLRYLPDGSEQLASPIIFSDEASALLQYIA